MLCQAAVQWGIHMLRQVSRSSAKLGGTPELDAALLLAHILNITQIELITQTSRKLSLFEWECYQSLIYRSQAGVPIAYLLGEREFWSLALQVSPACLIPRPETEHLIEYILAYYPKEVHIRVADLGTGSGAIALALASERPCWDLVATDHSVAALQIAKRNAQQLGIANIEFKQGDWCDALASTAPFHCIVSNPPYLSENDPHLLDSRLQYEPRRALVAGITGMEALHNIIAHARPHLLLPGSLWLEQGFNQAKEVAQLLHQYGYSHIQQYQDLAGVTRISKGERRSRL